MKNAKHGSGSFWTIAGVAKCLGEFRRIDDGSDFLALCVAGDCPHRTAYIYLYGEAPESIHFDLQDASVENGSWDHVVRKGSARSIDELRSHLTDWFRVESGDFETVAVGDGVSSDEVIYDPIPWQSDR